MREINYENWVKLYKCKRCGNLLPREKYSKDIMCYDFISTRCKDCLKIERREYEERNKEKFIAYRKKYRETRKIMAENPHLDVATVKSIISNTILTKAEPVPEPEPTQELKLEPIEPTQEEPKNSYEKEYPEAYKKIMSDEDTKRAFWEKYNEEQRISYLKREQEAINKRNEELEYESDKNKMRAMCDSLLEWNEKKMFEQAVHSLNWEWQDKFVHRLWKIPAHHFKDSWKCVYDNILESKKWNWDINDL